MPKAKPPDPRLYDLAKDWAARFRARPLSQERANILCKQGRVPGAVQWPKTGPNTLRLWYVPKGTKEVRHAIGVSMTDKVKTAAHLPYHIRASEWAASFDNWPMTAQHAAGLCKAGRVKGAVQFPKNGPIPARHWWVPCGTKDPRKAHGRPKVPKSGGKRQ